jgi:hypothetical protein
VSLGPFTSPQWEPEARRRLLRSYPFSVLPAQIRQTFAAPTIALLTPQLSFTSAGAAAETNKIYEAAVEQVTPPGNTTFRGPFDTNGDSDFHACMRVQMQGSASVPANLDANAFVGFEFRSAGQAVLTNNPPQNGAIRIEQRLDNPTQWRAKLLPGGGGAATIVNFSIPADGGNLVEIEWLPFFTPAGGAIVRVNNIQRALFDFNVTGAPQPFFLADQISVGLLVYSGTQTGATQINASWTGCVIESLDTFLIGSGFV